MHPWEVADKIERNARCMKNEVDYSLYKCPYEHLQKDCGHELHGPEGYENTYGIWCSCGFNGPVFYLNPDDLKLEKKGLPQTNIPMTVQQRVDRLFDDNEFPTYEEVCAVISDAEFDTLNYPEVIRKRHGLD